ncbi:MAG: class 1 fructose-bisphosphatase [Anaerolineae bacterium]|nr:class 1 fructose-bisphosphatase [Anaerolineae bacterium]
MTQITTIERHILDQQRLFPEARGTFTQLMYDVGLFAKLIAREVRHAGLVDILGRAGSTNIQGEEQQKLDVYAHDTIVRMMEYTGRVCIMASEEIAGPIRVPEEYGCGDYVLLFDPLDGSSNIDYNVSTGTIFSVHRRVTSCETPGGLEDLLQPGYRQVAAGYVIYGSSTMLVYTAGQGVHGFTLDASLGEFLLSHPDIRIPDAPGYYSVNAGYARYWTEGVRRYVEWLTGRTPDSPAPAMPLRYTGSLVADFHRTLLAGGVFLYPADTRDAAHSHGKLRLCYECAPLAFIMAQAGGYASDGVNPILNLLPRELHQRAPFFVGNARLVREAERFIARYDADWAVAYRDQVVVVREPTEA